MATSIVRCGYIFVLVVSAAPGSILYRIFLILNSHPASHSCTMESKEWAARHGMMCAILALAGSSGRARMHMYVELTRAPSGSFTLSGFLLLGNHSWGIL